MSRLGLSAAEAAALADDAGGLAGIDIRLVISHLACADEPGHPLNRRQLEAFRALRARFRAGRAASFANSSGIFLGADYHFDLVRPGAALYGIAPVAGAPNPMAGVVALHGKILQIRDVDTNQTVGYGATHRLTGPGRLATVAVGYADGYLRSLSNRGWAFVGDVRVPIVGRVSMDLITLDVTGVAAADVREGASVELIGPHLPVDVVAEAAGTIGYEILTGLGRRYHRDYRGGATRGR
jgi:alanine racemase